MRNLNLIILFTILKRKVVWYKSVFKLCIFLKVIVNISHNMTFSLTYTYVIISPLYIRQYIYIEELFAINITEYTSYKLAELLILNIYLSLGPWLLAKGLGKHWNLQFYQWIFLLYKKFQNKNENIYKSRA